MIVQVCIKNFAVAKDLDLDLQKGMTVLTGETGAGKSIIIDALSLVLGGRIDGRVASGGAGRSEISAVFDVNNIPQAKSWLEEHELTDGDECIIRRVINGDGRSRSTINEVPCSQQSIKKLGNLLINIHGQNQQQGLLQSSKQLELLDNFANHSELLTQVKENYFEWKNASAELTELRNKTSNYQDKVELLNYQIKELEELSLQEGELDVLHHEYKQLTHAEKILQSCAIAIELLEKSDLVAAKNKLEEFTSISPQLGGIVELIEGAIIQAQEANEELQQHLTTSKSNPDRLHLVEERLNKIYDIARKHRIKPEEVVAFNKNLIAERHELEAAQNNLDMLQATVEKLVQEYKLLAKKLSKSREKAKKGFSKQIVAQMQLLNMRHANFDVKLIPLEKEGFSAQGCEQVNFFATTNPDQPLQLLSKVASGGELSRISLAIQVITAQKQNMPALIFDEIDAGIGGKTAQIVGKLLQQLGDNTQVLCVTHLPQVAVCGHNHLRIDKKVVNNMTTSEIKRLVGDGRIKEVARMVGGAKITTQTLAHAKEMLGDAQNGVN